MAASAKDVEEGPMLVNATPMVRQYLEVKAKHPDSVLFFRLGDFYEMFFEDAVRAAEILQITLTARAKGSDRIPMCGVPYHSARRYIAKLVDSGLKVAICEQVTEPNGTGIVQREVTRTVTPGMMLDDEVLDGTRSQFLASVKLSPQCGAALLEASTGEFWALEADSPEALAQELSAVDPREIVFPEDESHRPLEARFLTALGRTLPTARVEAVAFDPKRASAFLCGHFKVASLEGFGLVNVPAAVGAAGAALRYLKDTQRQESAHIDRLSLSPRGGQLVMDEASRQNLELVQTLRDGSRKGSLLGVLDRTRTSLGARKLQRWLLSPLVSLPQLESRLDAVEALSTQSVWRQALSEMLKGVGDLERLCGRLCLGAGNGRDLRALSVSLDALPVLAESVDGPGRPSLLSLLLPPLRALGDLSSLLKDAVAEEPPVTLKEGGIIRSGYHAELDELVMLATSGKDYLLKLEAREREATGISSLKVRFNKVFGYFIEITRSNLGNVPAHYERKQTTVNAERFVIPELKEYEEKVLTAEERRFELEYRLFEELRGRVMEAAPRLKAAAEAVATLDVLVSLATCAAEYGYVRPSLDDSEVLDIVGGRHPVVERMLQGERFVPNDVRIDSNDAQLLVLTGPNMAGKSTIMRQVALTVVMAQIGSFVPAERARIGLCDRIFTRVGAADNLARGQSTFMVEMIETANILHHATKKSLVILDEIGRGTSTFDGLSIAWAVAEHLHDAIGARALFATHYHELTDLERERPRVRNCSIAVKEHQGKVIFLRKLVPQGASRSYGIEVARLAGLPKEVLARARVLLGNLESGEFDEDGRPRLIQRERAAPNPQLGLFLSEPGPKSGPVAGGRGKAAALPPHLAEWVGELSGLDVNGTTPLEALTLLSKWKASLESQRQS